MTNKTYLLCMTLIASPCSHAADTPYNFNLNTGLLYDDNIARATLEQDIVSDNIINLGLNADYRHHIQHESIVIFSGAVDAYQYQDFDKLSNIILSAKADYQIQPSHGFTAPWYHASFEYSLVNYQSTLRDSDGFTIELGMGKRLTDRINFRSGLIYEDFEAEADEFDLENYRLYFSFDYKTSTANTYYLTLGYNDGNVATSTTDNTTASPKPAPTINKSSVPTLSYAHHLPNEVPGGNLRPDDAFQNGFVYQLDTNAITIQLGDNYALSSFQSIDASIFYYSAEDDTNSKYDGIIAQLSYLHQF